MNSRRNQEKSRRREGEEEKANKGEIRGGQRKTVTRNTGK